MRPIYSEGPEVKRYFPIFLIVGLVAAVVAVVGYFISDPQTFYSAYLFSYLFTLEFALGCLAVLMLHYLVGGLWGTAIRRVLEAGAKTIWVMAILFIPIVIGARYLYPWMNPDIVASDAMLAHKAAYLNLPFFIVRAVIYFAIWIFFSWRAIRMAQNPLAFVPSDERRRLQGFNALGLIAYILTITFASTDWLMSLQPLWYSSIFGMLITVAQALTGFAFAIAVLSFLLPYQPLRGFVKKNTIRDLGAFLLTFVILWSYMTYSQYLIIWAGNIPREATWYLIRGAGGWLWIALLVIAVQFIFPFMILISSRAKQNVLLLFVISASVLLMRLLDNYWHVIPAFHPASLHVHWLYIITPAALFGLWAAAFTWYLASTRQPVPVTPQEEVVDASGRRSTTF